jgi:hypothetical protein
LSTPRAEDGDENEPQDEPRNGLFLRALRAFAALCAAIALYALWSVERVSLDCDLQLAAPIAARPGETIATRALVFCELDSAQGPRLARPARLSLALLDRAGRTLTATELQVTELDTFERSLSLPRLAAGGFLLEAKTIVDDIPLSVRRAIQIAQDAASAPIVGREAGALQQYALGRVHTLAGPAPDRMLPRVVGGACVPDHACELIVWVGAPAATISVRLPPEVTLRRTPAPAETEGLATLELEVHGPDAEITLEARRAGTLVAERALRLPIALGEPALHGGASLGPPSDAAFVAVFPPGRSLIGLDLFYEGRWIGTRVVSRPEVAIAELTRGLVGPGLLRVQARTDRFSADAAGVRMIYLGAGLRELASALESPAVRAWLAPLDEPGVPRASAIWAERPPLGDPQTHAAFLLAPAEATRAYVPLPSSGRPAQLQRLDRTKVRMRYGVAGALALSAWLISLSIARRGLLAVDQAQAIMAEARADDRADEAAHHATRERINARAKVLLMVLAVAAAFLAGALLIAAKSLWF